MGIMEIHPAQGGADAELFSRELAEAIAKASNSDLTVNGTTYILPCL